MSSKFVTVGSLALQLQEKQPSPIVIAATKGHFSVVKELISRGMDINSTDSMGMTPLMAACEHDHTNVAKLLIEKGADISLRNNYGMTALYIAANGGNLELVESLLDNGATVGPEYFEGSRATRARRPSIERALMSPPRSTMSPVTSPNLSRGSYSPPARYYSSVNSISNSPAHSAPPESEDENSPDLRASNWFGRR